MNYSIQNYETITLNPKSKGGGGGGCGNNAKARGKGLVATMRRCDVMNKKMKLGG